MSIEETVVKHYEHGSLEGALFDALKRAGKDTDKLTHADLALVDEFHIGGRPATRELGAQIDLLAGSKVLDIGCGIGGPSRYFAAERGWKIEGVDLTPEYVAVAQSLSRRVGLDSAVTYRVASATALPFPDASFDGAYMLHVGMNIADKKAVFAEVKRVLKPGGVFAIYDAMRLSDDAFVYPVAWSSEPATNHIASAAAYKAALAAAGLTVEKERSRLEFALESMQRRAAAPGQPGLGPPVVMGATAPQKVANMIDLMKRGVFAPTEIISRRAA
jgi:ubiquinone/menaquinone biosynthesis C-methylase UbiE